ncbi:MAG TPA: tetratricopeptide repeat protein [Thermoanaerobaculia bacterium]|nr:tetratricopeptide repeat protein [Thermoanaerobaculia bacterium]
MSAATIQSRFDSLNHRGHLAAEAGLIEEALALFDQLLAVAEESGEERLVDLAFCNRAAIAILVGKADREAARLREILMRNGDAVNARLAAYNLSRHFEVNKSYKKAMFYARITHERSCAQRRQDWIASSHNLIGNILLAESFTARAVEEYEKALALMPAGSEVWMARILANLGYCRVLQHRVGEGFTLLFKSLRLLRTHAAERFQATTHLDLSYAYLEAGRYDRARRHGERALRIAERLGEVESQKNALYLLGEAANLSGHEVTARSYFGRLQNDFFPQADYLPSMLLAVNVRKLVNLHA